MKFKELIKNEKKLMNPIRRIINYIVVPLFLIFLMLSFIIILILMEIDENKYIYFTIGIFIFDGLLMIALLMTAPIIRKRELEIENSKYDFNIEKHSSELSHEYLIVDVKGINFKVQFKDNILLINNISYDYNDIDAVLVVSNHLLLVHLDLCFLLKKDNNDYQDLFFIKLNWKIINTLNKFNIRIQNKEVYDYIVNNKEDAFKQILSYGYIKEI